MPELRTSGDHAAKLVTLDPREPSVPALIGVTQALAAAESVQIEQAMLALAALRADTWPADPLLSEDERKAARALVRASLGLNPEGATS